MADAYEQKVLFWLRKMLMENNPQIGSGKKQITVDEVRLEPGEPEDQVVILFREAARPHCLFGFRVPAREGTLQGASEEQRKAWNNPEGTGPQVYADIIVNGWLRERIEAADMGLPANCDPRRITWI